MKTAIRVLGKLFSAFCLLSIFLYAGFDFQWWAPIEKGSFRGDALIVFHVIGLVHGVLSIGEPIYE